MGVPGSVLSQGARAVQTLKLAEAFSSHSFLEDGSVWDGLMLRHEPHRNQADPYVAVAHGAPTFSS